ncbi:MAG: IPT/TIG domain-containing protein, partial [Acidobacteriaceae bacterium]
MGGGCVMRGGRGWRGWLAVVAAMVATSAAWAGGPRFITGTSGFTTAGVPMAWYTSAPLFFVDTGELSPEVSNSAATAMVRAAAGVWNIPTANVTLALGGSLAEHVTADGGSPNVYFNGSEVVWPADVEATNYAAVQIPVVYDSDGSVIDTLLGSGASDPSGCEKNGVVESVDQFGSAGTIEHAVIVLNGLCVASGDPTVLTQQMTQMQYQLTRVFGRVLGLAWSQLNDGVFTGSIETAAAMALWPLMHPIDLPGNGYSYQAVQNPFTLRPDDLNALETLYPVMTAGGGKTLSSTNTVSASGNVFFPTDQGMELVDVIVYRWILGEEGGYEAYPTYASTTGYGFQQNGGNPVTGPEASSENAGSDTAGMEGEWSMSYMGAGPSGANLYFYTTEINPLYWGEYAVGAYQRPVVTESGGEREDQLTDVQPGAPVSVWIDQALATSNWCPYPDGTETSPSATSTTGWWNASLCAAETPAWRKLTVNANTSWTMEVTALNEVGSGTVQKLQPLMGVWNLTDPTGTLPTVASETAALNSKVLGMTQMWVAAATSASTYRIAIADAYGGGRPDFVYTARILYASGVSPATIGTAGGTITVSGEGFQTGNEVLVNGVLATATSWTSNQIVATVPRMATAGATSGTAVDVEVKDPTTGGTTDIPGSLTYDEGTKDVMALVSAPGALETGYVAATPFAVRVYQPDGATPAAGASVSFVVSGSGGGAAVATGCGMGPGCVVTTDATGLAST